MTKLLRNMILGPLLTKKFHQSKLYISYFIEEISKIFYGFYKYFDSVVPPRRDLSPDIFQGPGCPALMFGDMH